MDAKTSPEETGRMVFMFASFPSPIPVHVSDAGKQTQVPPFMTVYRSLPAQPGPNRWLYPIILALVAYGVAWRGGLLPASIAKEVLDKRTRLRLPLDEGLRLDGVAAGALRALIKRTLLVIFQVRLAELAGWVAGSGACVPAAVCVPDPQAPSVSPSSG